MRIYIFFMFAMVIVAAAMAQVEHGLAALQIGVGARPAAMGEAFTAVADDATSAFWNPAGNSWLLKRQAHFSHTEWFQDVQQNSASIVFPNKHFSFGLHVLLNSVTGIEHRLQPTEEPLSNFSAHDFVFGISLTKRISERLCFGANLRYVNEKIYIESADGFSLDVGLNSRTPIPGLQAGISWQHLGSTNELRQQKIRLPQTVRLGTAYYLPENLLHFSWLVAADYVYVVDEESSFHVGTEIQPFSLIALRLGYQTGWETHDISAGFGLKWDFFRIDYAYVPFKHDLGKAHRFTFLIDF